MKIQGVWGRRHVDRLIQFTDVSNERRALIFTVKQFLSLSMTDKVEAAISSKRRWLPIDMASQARRPESAIRSFHCHLREDS